MPSNFEVIMKKLILLSTVAAFPAVAQNSQNAQAPAIPSVPSESVMNSLSGKEAPEVLEYLMDSGVKLTYLGDAGGLKGYLGESPSGKVQTFYMTPDGNHVVAGVLFRSGGTNVTGVQVSDMENRYKAAQRNARIARGQADVPVTEVPEPTVSNGLDEVSSEEIQDGDAAMHDVSEYQSDRSDSNLRQDLESAAWFQVGSDDAPVVYMIADPNCPYCHQAWQDLRPRVMNGEISLRVLLIAGLQGSEAKSLSLLSRENPSRAWFAGEGSTRTQPVQDPPAVDTDAFGRAQRYLNRNMRLFERHDLTSTPTMFYHDSEGTLYETSGLPRDMDVFLGEVAQ
ncbi:Thiol:disulfide interchange protein DsbG precursor [Salipiger mucosus DSM 16094]|uniref:Thiol:disulfide interchange protein DsbG n=1 Tax=Salipiger mucosus DSM 16094 TaxID=1123237 RepID=S9SBA8_9RHOB|nr:Thiol:disulfide interchange protein DsbG precursor [Salipiger mucosus DSM 16094]